MYLLYAPEKKFGRLPPKTPLITEEVLFTHNVAYCPKFFWRKFHLLQGIIDVTPSWMKRLRKYRTLNNILFVATGGIGDVLWTMPFMKYIRGKYPRSKIVVATEEKTAPLFQNVPYVDICARSEFWNLQNLIRHADECWDFGGVATIYREYMKYDPVEAIFRWTEEPLPKNKKDCRPHLVLTIDEGKQAEAILRKKGVDIRKDKIISIAIESSTPNRDWPYTYTRTLSRLLLDQGYKVVWLGESKDFSHTYFHSCYCGWEFIITTKTIPDFLSFTCPVCKKETSLGNLQHEPGIVNLAGQTTLRQAMAIIALSDLFIGPNSGLMVIATALEIPTIGLFGSFDPATRTKFYEKFTPIWGRYKCSPCGEHWTECPEGHPAPCMKIITPEMVYSEVFNMLKTYPRKPIEKEPME